MRQQSALRRTRLFPHRHKRQTDPQGRSWNGSRSKAQPKDNQDN
jgi:hypothetical protein